MVGGRNGVGVFYFHVTKDWLFVVVTSNLHLFVFDVGIKCHKIKVMRLQMVSPLKDGRIREKFLLTTNWTRTWQ